MLHMAPGLLSVTVPLLLLASANQEPVPVIGLVNRSVEMSTRLHLPLPVEETVWKFTSDNTVFKVAEIGNTSLLTYGDKFKDRIRGFNNGTTIIIRNLSLRDAGKYCAEITLTSKEILRFSFNLIVYANQEPVPVIGLVNRSVEMSTRLHLPLPVEETVWKFTSDNTVFKVAEIGNTSLLTYGDKFKDRIRGFNNGTTIIIRNLSLRDAGKYCAEITLTSKEILRFSFNLIVYEPVPSPAIRSEWKGSTAKLCNVTLHCSVPSHTSDVSYTWKYRQQDSEYQLYNTGSIIQISLPPDHQDMEFLCIVQNPADQKNISVHIEQSCMETNNAGASMTQKKK
ncbi:SLAM family member 5-like [Eleutherodactylus coqui]|uniref:SLAM family member 5-like n=1 Tax=Eleutherodactylus coqui TaxID=57060 RepID=UPI0034625115